MSDRPIIFSPSMIRALLDGRKTMTRRIIAGEVPEPPAMDAIHPKNTALHPKPYLDSYCGAKRTAANPRGMSDRWCWWTRDDRQKLPTFKVPFVPGDRLWVREAFVRYYEMDGDDRPCGELLTCYRADGWPLDGWYDCDRDETRDSPPWRASIHMPRALSRLTLIVTEVKVERLQDISEEDAVAEGVFNMIRRDDSAAWVPPQPVNGKIDFVNTARFAFGDLWKTINGVESWDANPWVAAITFQAIRQNIDSLDRPVSQSGGAA